MKGDEFESPFFVMLCEVDYEHCKCCFKYLFKISVHLRALQVIASKRSFTLNLSLLCIFFQLQLHSMIQSVSTKRIRTLSFEFS